MKVAGIVLIVIGVLGLFQDFMRLASGNSRGGEGIAFGIGFIVLGAFLLNRAQKKAQKKIDKDKWENS